MIQEGAQAWAVHNFASGYEVGDRLAERLGFDPAVRNALRYTFEHWNGAGYPDHAAAEVRRLAAGLDPAAADAVLAAAGHGPAGASRRRPRNPGGLTGREAEVLRLAARGLTARAIGEALHISPKTADHHIQHVYSKIGVSTRAAAALWATQHAIVA